MRLANVEEPFLYGSDSAFIFITAINVAKLIFFFFQQFLQSYYVFVSLINMPLCKQADGGGGNEKSFIGTFWVVFV